jgi:hypothetical protein
MRLTARGEEADDRGENDDEKTPRIAGTKTHYRSAGISILNGMTSHPDAHVSPDA